MKVVSTSLAVLVSLACGETAHAQAPAPSKGPDKARPRTESSKDKEKEKKAACHISGNSLSVNRTTNLVVRLVNPPKTKVTLSIARKGGFHHELVWDPTVGDGLKHDVLLEESLDPITEEFKREPNGELDYELMAYAEEDRIQTQHMVVLISTRFRPDPSATGWVRRGTLPSRRTTEVLTGSASTVQPKPPTPPATPPPASPDPEAPQLVLECETDGVEMSKQYLDAKRLYAASVSRGFLDQAAPAVVTDTLALLAEIAVERAKSGALELVRDRFVTPMCDKLRLSLLKLGDADERAFPRTCALLENMRLQDLFSAGRNLVEAARDDIRLTLVPTIITKANLPAAARDLAVVALTLGNQMIDGGGNELAEIDLLLTQLDRLFQRGLPANLEEVKRAFINASTSRLEKQKDVLIAEYLARVLPEDPGRLVSKFVQQTDAEKKLAELLEVTKVEACYRAKDTESAFVPADRTKCTAALTGLVGRRSDWLEIVRKTLSSDVLIRAIESADDDSKDVFKNWLGTARAINVVQVSESLLNSCAIRVTIAIVKWCSGRDSCTAGRIATALDDPRSLFRPPTGSDLGDNLCWTHDEDPGKRLLRLPTDRSKFIELATRALAFLTPPGKGEERARVEAILHWMFDLARSVDPTAVDAIQKLEEILALFEKGDYVRAIAQAMTMAVGISGCDKKNCRPVLDRTMQLVGAVTSYLQVYDETKNADATEAKAARKKAIESLIDSATDRKDRGRQWIVSLGSNVGVAIGWTDRVQLKDARTRFHGVRVPLGLAYQYVPRESDDVWDGVCKEFLNLWGVHLGVQVADLGQFIETSENDGVTWSSFVAPGIEAGLLFGRPNRLLALTAHASYVPSLTESSAPVWRLGVALSYYVPFFDLN